MVGEPKRLRPKKATTGELWRVEDLMKQLVQAGCQIPDGIPEASDELVSVAHTLQQDDRFWRNAPQTIGGMSRARFRTTFSTAVDACRGFN
jgi:hypothetical protein